MMDTTAYFKEQFEKAQSTHGGNGLGTFRENAFRDFTRWGIPTTRHEEWKYTRINSLFNKEYILDPAVELTKSDLDGIRLPGHEQANELVFINGIFFPQHSKIQSKELEVLSLEEASSGKYKETIRLHLGHSAQYLKDGINALNTAFIHGAVYIQVKKGQVTSHPVYIYNINDTRAGATLSQPRSLVHVDENAQVQIVETYITIGSEENFTNQVMEIVVEKDAMMEYYKIQDDVAVSSQVSTTHIRQVGKSLVHAVTISLNGGIVRNNLNVVMEAERSEAHLYGLYFQGGNSHIDNHTVVDNVKPNCYSNELYKGIMDGNATGVFNGKIFVRQEAQKTNAYQSNKNILVSNTSSVNTKPQLEIFADDVKCSHGCTIGKLDDEGMFYLRSRGIRETTARALLLHAFVVDILEHIRLDAIRSYVDQQISLRLEHDIS